MRCFVYSGKFDVDELGGLDINWTLPILIMFHD